MTTSPLLLLLFLIHVTRSLVLYKDLVAPKQRTNSPAVIPLHLLEECPPDKENFLPWDGETCERVHASVDRVPTTAVRFECSFVQYCFNRTMRIKCLNYKRTCDTVTNTCNETYGKCEVRNETEMATQASSIPAKMYAECIPLVNAIRDQCQASFERAEVSWTYGSDPNELLSCSQDTINYTLNCYNYTRTCPLEVVGVKNTQIESTRVVDLSETECTEFITMERREQWMEIWNHSIQEKDVETGEITVGGPDNAIYIAYYNWTREDGWENCEEVTEVATEPQCNQFISHIMDVFKDVFYEPNAYNLTLGIEMFMQRWDEGFEQLCKYNCFFRLIKFSRDCWPRLPLQRFLPGADYRTIEYIMRNMTNIACYVIDPPAVKYEEEYMNARNSCAIFFANTNNITRTYHDNITYWCQEGPDMCTPQCEVALDTLASHFGCCLGSIMWQYNHTRGWFELLNFGNHPIIRRLEQCNTQIETRCETIFVTSLSVTIVRNLIYVIGGIMTFVIILMIISFYWQLEHEPIKKAFYHF